MTYLHINNESLTELQTFQTIDELNESIKEHKQAHDLTETDRNILDAISRYACKYKGVCYLSKQRIAEDAGYKSRRTAIRACKRLEALGIITTHETRRQGGDRRRSTDIIVINAVEVVDVYHSENECTYPHMTDRGTYHDYELRSNANTRTSSQVGNTSFRTYGKVKSVTRVTPQVTAESHSQEASLQTYFKHKYTYKDTDQDTHTRAKTNAQAVKPTADQVIKRGLKHAIPAPIYDALAPFFNGQALYDTYGILLRAKASRDARIRLEEHIDEYVNAFYNVVRLHKAGKVRKSMQGLLYTTWQQVTHAISHDKYGYGVYYDWLDE